jgi:hypothetical protein
MTDFTENPYAARLSRPRRSQIDRGIFDRHARFLLYMNCTAFFIFKWEIFRFRAT